MGIKYWALFTVHHFHRFIVWLVSPIFHWLYDDAHRGLPPITDHVLMMSAVELAKNIRTRQLTSVDVTNSFIHRIRQVNPYINAVVADRYKEALKEAEEVDRILDSGDIPEHLSEVNAPFLGVPMTTKEAICVAGMPNSSGLLSRRNVISEHDADTIALMRKAGAIPLAVTNISEVCMWYESSNLLYGRSCNAYHQGRIVGGSSGGEGCILSAAASPMGIGADVGGSIRMPAFFNGIFGHKPSTDPLLTITFSRLLGSVKFDFCNERFSCRIVSNDGQYPMAKGEALSFLGTGPMCRYATDLLPMFKLLVLPEWQDRLRLDEQVDVRKLKYYYMEDDGGGLMMTPAYEVIKETVRKAAKHFESIGCTVKRVSFHQFKKSFAIWSSLMATAGNDTFCSLLANGPPNAPVKPLHELLLWLIGQRRHTLPAIGLGLFEGVPTPPEKLAELRRLRDSLLEDLEEVLGSDGVFLYPPHPRPAPFHHEPIVVLFNFSYTAIFNVLGVPVTAVPMGISLEEGVPTGVQVVASRFHDRLALSVAVELERAFGGWVPPSEVIVKGLN